MYNMRAEQGASISCAEQMQCLGLVWNHEFRLGPVSACGSPETTLWLPAPFCEHGLAKRAGVRYNLRGAMQQEKPKAAG
jgi:hypothetical protein